MDTNRCRVRAGIPDDWPPAGGNDQAQDGWYVRLINPSDGGVRLAARVWVNRNAFTLLLAGGGFKAGYTHGETDDIGYHAVVHRVSIHDLHATIWHQLGIDHHLLGYPHDGRDERLTAPEVTGVEVVWDLLDEVYIFTTSRRLTYLTDKRYN